MDIDKVFSVSQLCGRKIKPTDDRFGHWLLLENMYNNNLITDIGNINYVDGEELLKSPTPITDPFCDNIMLVKICGVEDCEGEGKNIIIKKEICGGFNSILRGKFREFVSARHGVKAKLPFLLESDSRMAKGVRTIIGQDGLQSVTKKYIDPVCVPYKVELADVTLETLLEKLPDLLDQLKTDHFYLMDLDITQDFSGIFNKTEMCKYLVKNYKFCYQGEYRNNYNVIVKNDDTVGIDCLTWLTSNARIKIYNKFICQITSPGVNKSIGNHIIDFVNCPDARLRETFHSTPAKEHGITRLEATIYNYSNENYYAENKIYNPLEDCLTLLESSKSYFENAPVYSVPIAKMWTKLTENLQNSCCLVFNNMLQFVYWGNTNTKKLTGLQLKLKDNLEERAKLVSYVISAFGFNCLPINFLEVVEEDGNKDNVRIIQKCFVKVGETYFSRTGTPFSTIPEEINLEEHGLVKTSNVIPQVLRKRSNINSKLSPYPIKEIVPLAKAYVLSTQKRKLELEEMSLKKRKMEYLEQTASIKEEYMDLLEKESEIAVFKDNIVRYFKTQWKNLDTFGSYNIYAYVVNNKKEYPIVGVLAEKDGNKAVYFIKGYTKNMFLNASRDSLTRDGFIFIPYNDMDIITLPTQKPFVTFNTNGVTTFNRHSFAKVENVVVQLKALEITEDVNILQEDMDKLNEVSMREIKGKIGVRECRRLEELLEGTELVIVGLKQITTRNKLRYVLQLENLDALYISNYWLEKEFQQGNIDLNYKIKIKLDTLKHTSSRNKERVVFCV